MRNLRMTVIVVSLLLPLSILAQFNSKDNENVQELDANKPQGKFQLCYTISTIIMSIHLICPILLKQQ